MKNGKQKAGDSHQTSHQTKPVTPDRFHRACAEQVDVRKPEKTTTHTKRVKGGEKTNNFFTPKKGVL